VSHNSSDVTHPERNN